MKTSHLGAQYSDGRITPLHKPTVLVCAVFLRGSMKRITCKAGSITLSELKSISVMSGNREWPVPPLSLCCHPSIQVSEVTVLDEGTDSGLSGSV